MSPAHLCPECQQPLAPDAPDGLCPQCLLKAAAGPSPASHLDGLPDDIIDIADPEEVRKRLPQFEIHELIGRGGMGVVYRARQQQLDRVVALKILPQVDALSPDFVARFTREARSLARLNHPNIVHVYDFGETNGLYYIVMEFVDGKNLRELFETRKLSPTEALAIVPRICDALQYAHEEGIVHRDIKPENILIDKRGSVKIADFGLAKLLRREPLDLTLTLSGMSLGTLRYMAPEQMDKPETVDHRADLYSLGVVFYEMLTGELPLGRFELPSQKSQVDARLDEIVLHALEREPARRYQHASEVRQDVERVSQAPSVKSSPATAVTAHGGAVAPETNIVSATPTAVVAKPRKRHLLQATLTLVWFLTFVFAVNFYATSGMVNGVRTHFVTVGSFDPLFIYESHPSGFHNSFNLLSWSFLAAIVSVFVFSAIWRIDREDAGKAQRDFEWWLGWWKQAGFWCGIFLIACIVRTVMDPDAMRKARTPKHDLGLASGPAKSPEQKPALFEAVAAGNVSQVRELVRGGTSVNDKDAEGTPALIVAARHGHTAVVAALVVLGADVNARDAEGRTALIVAAELNHASIIKMLFDLHDKLAVARREIRELDPNDRIAPHVQPGPSVPNSTPSERSPADVIAANLPMIDAQLLEEIGTRIPQINVDSNAQDRKGETALMKAAARGHIQAAAAMRSWEGETLQDQDGRTAAMHLALRGQGDFARWLLKARYSSHGTSVGTFSCAPALSAETLAITDKAGKTAIQLARESGHPDIADILVAEMERTIDHYSRAIAANSTPIGAYQYFTCRGWAHRALGHADEAVKDFAEAAKAEANIKNR
jgi:serine/threonine protein kinase/ankyrin repeat protein